MPRFIIAIAALFGVVAGASPAEPIEKLETSFADSIEKLDKSFADRLDARVEEISSSIVSDAVEISLGASSLQSRETGNRLASRHPGAVPAAGEAGRITGSGSAESSTTAGSGGMNCRVANDRVLECMVRAETDAGSGRISATSVPAAPAGN